MQQAFCKALGKDKHEIKEYVIKEVLSETKGTKTVEEISFGYHDRSQIQGVIEAIQEFLGHNVLRITKYRTLLCYNKTAEKVLRGEYNRVNRTDK